MVKHWPWLSEKGSFITEEIKLKTGKWDCRKSKIFCTARQQMIKQKAYRTTEKFFASYASDRIIVYIHNELQN